MISVMSPKDYARVQRSIASIMAKVEVSLERTAPLRNKREEEFEAMCIAKGLIYFP